MSDSPAPGTPQTPTKAVVAYVASFVVAVLAKIIADKTGFDELGVADFLWSLILAVVPAGLVYGIPNQAKSGTRSNLT